MKSQINDSSIIDWGNLDPTDWRNMPDPESLNEKEIENDGDVPCPLFVKELLGFDPDDLE